MNLKIIIAQLNFLAGDIEGNTQKVIDSIKTAEQKQADLIIFPELTLTFYSAQDLWLKPDIDTRIKLALESILSLNSQVGILLGYPRSDGNHLYNEAAFIKNGKVVLTYQKQCLPNYNIFDEKRYFSNGKPQAALFSIKNVSFAFIICEDLWHPNPMKQAAEAGANAVIVINASPFTYEKHEQRTALLQERAQTHQLPIIYANWVGGQDDLVFDGGSCIVNEKGQIIQQAPFFKEQLWETFLPQTHASLPFKKIDPIEHIYAALVLGTRDYMIKNQFPSALIGLSGGLDSALTLAIAVDAVGKSNVKTIMMPSRFTSDLSLHYAKRQADLLGVSYEVISIEPIFTPFLQILSLSEKGLTAENLQARCRGMLLMALSNKTGSIVLTTGNKSELAVGYTTLYGDMAGGFAPLKDIYKTMAYRLAAYKNKNATTILPEIIARAPSAELAPNQKDQDSLPPYEVLDKLLFDYIEKNKSLTQLVESGFNKTQAKEIIERVCRSEYKRKQAPLGVKISPQAFGSDWRYPITTKACTKAY